MIPRRFEGEPAIVLGTGPSLGPMIPALQAARAHRRARLFGMNSTFLHFPLQDVFISCNIEWWDHYGASFRAWAGRPTCDAYHWDRACAERHGIEHIEGRWGPGLSVDPGYIHLGHSSGVQCLNLAVLYGCDPILLVGFDLTYPPGQPRHYFSDLSDVPGEYPPALRHYPRTGPEGLLPIYDEIAAQPGLPRIINCTPGGKLNSLPRARLEDALRDLHGDQ